ncbi:MAG: hypothetical protein KKE11_00985 [Gammaproteobacteria bacterium]|nr:hypothetical protein [Gammaproteobacteria bacterium]
MSKHIPAKLKAQLGECLAEWYRHFGKVAPRRAYHEDDESGGEGTAKPVFDGHPYLNEMPLGASSDLSSIIVNDSRTLDEANKRSDELTLDLQNKLDLALGQKRQNKFIHQHHTKPLPF